MILKLGKLLRRVMRFLGDVFFLSCLIYGDIQYKLHKWWKKQRARLYWMQIRKDETNIITQTVKLLDRLK